MSENAINKLLEQCAKKSAPATEQEQQQKPQETSGVVMAATLPERVYADATYFEDYGRVDVHQLMLMDDVRTSTYRDALVYNKHLLRNKLVLDVGCGTGILSMFAAKAGAKHIIAVDSANIALMAKRIIYDNGLDHAITVVKDKIEQLEKLPGGILQVDVIVSEWMGFCLFYESMLNTVLHARDRWLRPGGKIIPDKAQLFLVGLSDRNYLEREMKFWNKVQGFNMSALKAPIGAFARVMSVAPRNLITSSALLHSIDLYTMTNELCDFTAPFLLTGTRHGTMHALCAYFNVRFTHAHTPLKISTAPDQRTTHWHQTVFYLDQAVRLQQGQAVQGSFRMYANPGNERCMDFDIELQDPCSGQHISKQFKLRP